MSGKRRLVTYVHVNGLAYGPDSDVPDEVAKQITNPKAWGEVEKAEPDAGVAEKSETEKAPAKKAASSKSSSSK